MRLNNFAKTLVSGMCAAALIPAGLLAASAANNLQEQPVANKDGVTTSVANTPKFLTGCIGTDQLGHENVTIKKLPAGKDWFLTISDSENSPFATAGSYKNPNAGGYMYTFDAAANANYRFIREAVVNTGFGLAGSYHFNDNVKKTYGWLLVQLDDELYGALRVNAGCDYDFSTVLENNVFDKYVEIKKLVIDPTAVKQEFNPRLTLHQFTAPQAGDFKVLDSRPTPPPTTDPSTEPSDPNPPEVPDSPTLEPSAPQLSPSPKAPSTRDSQSTQTKPSQSSSAAPSAATQNRTQPAPTRTIIQTRENTRTVTVPGPIRYREAPTNTSSNTSSGNNASSTDSSSATSNSTTQPTQEGSGSVSGSTGNGTASQVQGVEQPKAAPSAPAAAKTTSNPSVVNRMGGLGTIAAIAVLGLIGAGGAIALTRSLMNG